MVLVEGGGKSQAPMSLHAQPKAYHGLYGLLEGLIKYEFAIETCMKDAVQESRQHACGMMTAMFDLVLHLYVHC